MGVFTFLQFGIYLLNKEGIKGIFITAWKLRSSAFVLIIQRSFQKKVLYGCALRRKLTLLVELQKISRMRQIQNNGRTFTTYLLKTDQKTLHTQKELYKSMCPFEDRDCLLVLYPAWWKIWSVHCSTFHCDWRYKKNLVFLIFSIVV